MQSSLLQSSLRCMWWISANPIWNPWWPTFTTPLSIPHPPLSLSMKFLASRTRGAMAGLWPQKRAFWPLSDHVLSKAFYSEGVTVVVIILVFPSGDYKPSQESHSADDKQFCSISGCCTKWSGLWRISMPYIPDHWSGLPSPLASPGSGVTGPDDSPVVR